MSLQLCVEAEPEVLLAALPTELRDGVEAFRIKDGLCGLSVPTKLLAGFPEEKISGLLRSFRYYNLWSGEWAEA